MDDMEGLSDLESEMDDPNNAKFEEKEVEEKPIEQIIINEPNSVEITRTRDPDQDPVDFIITEVEHLGYKDRVDIRDIIIEDVGTDVIFPSSDGSRIDVSQLPESTILKIETLIEKRLKDIDITVNFSEMNQIPMNQIQKNIKENQSISNNANSEKNKSDEEDKPKKSKKSKKNKKQKRLNKT